MHAIYLLKYGQIPGQPCGRLGILHEIPREQATVFAHHDREVARQ